MSLVIQPEARAVRARASGYRMDGETENFIVDGQNAATVEEVGSLGTGAAHGNRGFMVAGALRASDGHHGHSSPRGDGADNLIAWDDRNQVASDDAHHTLRPFGLQRSDGIAGSMGVRRLTPLECERLMAWPDGHTKYTADGHEIPDSHRYRMCGNGVVATVAEWLGHRLVQADTFIERAA